MKARMMFAVAGVGTLISSSAFAQEGNMSPDPAAAPKVRVQAQIEMLPVGSFSSSEGNVSASVDTAFAYGVSAGIDYAVHPLISVGVAPRLVLNVNADGADGDAGKEIDLRARVLAHYPVSPGLEVYGSLSPGYAIVTSGQDGVDSATGLSVAGAVGVTYDVSPTLFVSGELGYQRAFTSVEQMDVDVSYLHLGLGAGTRF